MRRTHEGTTSRKNAGARRLSFLDRVVSLLSASAALRRAIHLKKQRRMAQAFTLFARAAGAGIAEAEYWVGRCYLEGSGVPVCLTESLSLRPQLSTLLQECYPHAQRRAARQTRLPLATLTRSTGRAAH